MPELYTIGHSNHAIGAFLERLRLHGIAAVVDVRSQPYSRRHPQYGREALRDALTRSDIEYVFLGRELGARSEDPECYVDGRVDFARLARTTSFRSGLATVTERATWQRVALLCAEKDPLTCHRAILVCRVLHVRAAALERQAAAGTPAQDGSAGTTPGDASRHRWTIHHVLADGRIEEHGEMERRLLEETGIVPDLLRGRDEALADAYRTRADQIAWRKP